MKHKKFLVLGIIFLAYVVFINFFGDYSLLSQTVYTGKAGNTSGLEVALTTTESLTVEIRRARDFCLLNFCLLPTYIYFPRIYFSGFNLYISNWEEIRVKDLNFWFIVAFVILFLLFAVIEIFKYSKNEKDYYEE
jgi:hypothetical protein